MRHSTQPLDEVDQALLRQLVGQRGATRLAGDLGVERGAIARAAAGDRVLAGTRRLIADGLERLRAAGGLRSAS